MNDRRLLGAYYTPDDVAEVLARWALSGLEGNVLDPSYGGCAFLTAAVRVLTNDGVPNPGSRVYGVDIEETCAESVKDHESLVADNCITADFLQISPDKLSGSPFGAIIGNPPFVRHHWIRESQRDSARAVADESAVPLPATASLWAYFLLHSLDFLEIGGRLAILVPEAILQTDYAAPLRQALASRFQKTLLVYIRERLFDGTDEAVVVVAASGFGTPGAVRQEVVESVNNVESLLTSGDDTGSTPLGSSLVGRLLSREADALLQRFWRNDSVRHLSDLATVRIGVVTGANGHFIRSKEDLDALDVPDSCRHPIIARTRWLTGLQFGGTDHQALAEKGAHAFLVRPPDGQGQEVIQRWIDEGTAQEIQERHHCLRRPEWFRIDLPAPPDAFSTCTRLGSPLLVLNQAAYHCSNALHRISWRETSAATSRQVAVAFLTSPAAIWAELHGRRYGGGVLKLEPGALKRMPIPVIDGVEDVFDELDRLLREGDEEMARQRADDRVLGDEFGFRPAEIECLQEAREQLMNWRQPTRSGDADA